MENNKFVRYRAFTLAEMMVVMLIVSIVLACLAPGMTTRMKANQDIQLSPWKWADNNSDAYFSVGSNQSAMIGLKEKAATDSAKFIIDNSTNLTDFILFKNGANVLGRLRFNNGGLVLGSRSEVIQQNSVSIGNNANASSSGAIAIGQGTTASAQNSVSIGNNANASSSGAIAIGQGTTASAESSVSIGNSISSSSVSSIAIGRNINTSGNSNILLGHRSNNSGNNSGQQNVAIGVDAGFANNEGECNTYLGHGAGYSNTEGNYNVAIGGFAGYSNTTASNNTFIGSSAGHSNTTASNNTFIGSSAGYSNTTGTENTYIGLEAGVSQNGYQSTYIGYRAGAGIAVENTLKDQASGENNVFIGYKAGENNQGWTNTFIGGLAGWSSLSGYQNTIIGYKAGYGMTSGGGVQNTLIGAGAGTSIGDASGVTALGKDACARITGSNKTCIGANSGSVTGFGSYTDNIERIFLGSPRPAKIGGDPAILQAYRDSSSGTGVDIYGSLKVDGSVIVANEVVHLSDLRLKNVGKENQDGLEKLRQIKVVNYTFKKDDAKTPRVGVIAQDLQKIFPNAVKKGADGFLTIRMEDMFYAVINAIKELDSRLTALERENKQLKEQVKSLEKENKQFKEQLSSFDLRLKTLETKRK